MTFNKPGFITIHIVNDIPYSNLNRDDSGTPKRTIAGGVERGLLSSQSIKRAIRKDYEKRVKNITPVELDDSYRSRNLPELVVERAISIATKAGLELNEKKTLTNARQIIKNLTGKDAAKEASSSKDTITWLSLEEIEALASILANESEGEALAKAKGDAAYDAYMNARGATGSLAIASFGRMFANATGFQTEAAIAVSPAISTHGSVIETDYFIAADDHLVYSEEKSGGAGAGHLGISLFTSGIFYRTLTIDVKELWANWTGRDSEFKDVLLEQFLTSVIYALPTGKKNSTAPYTEPLLVIAEQQNYRSAYSVTAPILNPGEDGYISKTVEMLKKQSELARKISGSNYSERAISGVKAEDFVNEGEQILSISDLATQVMVWLEEQIPTIPEAEATTEQSAGN